MVSLGQTGVNKVCLLGESRQKAHKMQSRQNPDKMESPMPMLFPRVVYMKSSQLMLSPMLKWVTNNSPIVLRNALSEQLLIKLLPGFVER